MSSFARQKDKNLRQSVPLKKDDKVEYCREYGIEIDPDKTYEVAYSRSDLSNVYILMEDCSFKSCRLSPHQAQYTGLSQSEVDVLKRHERK